jgi:hypothetical protein
MSPKNRFEGGTNAGLGLHRRGDVAGVECCFCHGPLVESRRLVARSILNRAGGKPLTEDPDRKAQDQACKEIKPAGHSDNDDDREAGQ